MRNSEKAFLKIVKDEMSSLDSIAKKLNLSDDDALNFAEYLNKHNLIRLDRMTMSDGKTIHIVCKPLLKDTYWRNLWGNIIATCIGAIVGALVTVFLPQFSINSKENTKKITTPIKDTLSKTTDSVLKK